MLLTSDGSYGSALHTPCDHHAAVRPKDIPALKLLCYINYKTNLKRRYVVLILKLGVKLV